jgi:hypothetical protein
MAKKKNNNQKEKYYIVKNNDNIRDIAKKYNMSWTKLYNKNKNIIDEKAVEHGRFTNSYNYLYEGTKLIIGE